MADFQNLIQRGLRSAQPAASAVNIGTLYHVTDEGETERSNGSAWQTYSDGGAIADDAVTNAKLANMAQATVKGRAAGAGTGDPTDLTANQLSTLLDSATDPFARTSVIGDVDGPASATDHAIARFDGTTGKLLQDTSAVTLSDAGAFTFPDNVRQTFNPGANAAGLNVGSVAGDPDTPSNGDLWYDSSANELTARINGANVALGAGSSASDSFKTIAVSGQSDVVAESSTDTLTLVAGSNVTITTDAGTDTITIAASGGGSGDSTSTAAYASRPAASNDGNLFLPNNGFVLERDTGAAWVPWGPIFPLTTPVDGDFSWVNQGSATVTTTNGGICLRGPASGSGFNTIARVKSAPATPYTVTTCLLYPPLYKQWVSVGLVYRQSSDGKLVIMHIGASASQYAVRITKASGATTFVTDYQTFDLGGAPPWLKLADDGTNRLLSIGADGQNWLQIHSVSRTDYLTADQVGFCVITENNLTPNLDAVVTLVSWKEA